MRQERPSSLGRGECFMTKFFIEAVSRVPKSRNLAATLLRALSHATAQAHGIVTLEHLLLALIADGDASLVLQACSVDLGRLEGDLLRHMLETHARVLQENEEPAAAPDLLRILDYAAAAAQQSRRREINGAIVLAAIVGDGGSPAASLLRDQGLTFEAAIKALQRAGGSPRPSVPEAAAVGVTPSGMGTLQEAAIGVAGGASEAPAVDRSPPDLPAVQDGDAAPQSRVNGSGSPGLDDVLAPMRGPVDLGGTAHQLPEPGVCGQASSPPAGHEPRLEKRPRDRLADLPGLAPVGSGEQDQARPNLDEPANPVPYETGSASTGPPDRPAAAGAGPSQAPINPIAPAALPPALPSSPPRPTIGVSHWPHANEAGRPPNSNVLLGGERQQLDRASRIAPPVPHPASRNSRLEDGPDIPIAGFPYPRPDERAPLPYRRLGSRTSIAAAHRPAEPLTIGQLAETIPRVMRMGVPVTVEVRVAKGEIGALADGLQAGGAAYRHEIVVSKALSVRLRSPDGGFFIETASPEIQWIETALGVLTDDFASWRWVVTPRARGLRRLQLVVSARTIGSDGVAAETALPDRTVDVSVRANLRETLARWTRWLVAALAGALLAKYGSVLKEGVVTVLQALGGGV